MTKCNTEYGAASFKGIEFEILPVEYTSRGQVILTHLYPLTGYHYNEQIITSTPKRFRVRGAFHGDDFRDQLDVAERIWSAGGAGVFFEPTQNKNHTVVLSEPVDYSFDHKKINYCEFTLTFVEKGDSPYPNILAGIFGQVNSIIDGFISTVSTAYSEVMQTVEAFNDITTGFDASVEFVRGTVRQTVGSGFITVISPVNSASATRNADSNVQTVTDIFETAASNNAPLDFYKQASELRIDGNEVQTAQADLFALTALGYYFEQISDGVDYTELKEFRDRAEALKANTDDGDIINAIDALILAAGAATTHIPTYALEGTHHALVASYKLYGDVSKAYDILEWSGGVSGAQLDGVTYYQ